MVHPAPDLCLLQLYCLQACMFGYACCVLNSLILIVLFSRGDVLTLLAFFLLKLMG